MPVPINMDGDTKAVSKQLRRIADEVDKIKRSGNKNPKASVGTIAQKLSDIADALHAGNGQPSVQDPQYTTMADAFQAIADELRP